jgi:hypothetical protein
MEYQRSIDGPWVGRGLVRISQAQVSDLAGSSMVLREQKCACMSASVVVIDSKTRAVIPEMLKSAVIPRKKERV